MRYSHWYWRNVVNPELCSIWINRYKTQLQPGKVNVDGSHETEVASEWRKSNVCFPKEDDVLSFMRKFTLFANREAFGVDVSDFVEVQFTQYLGDENGYYNPHIDSYLNLSRRPYDRKLSAVALLSDPNDFEGGELFIGKEEIKLAKGDVVVFPSFLIHQVKPVTSGERYTLVSWMEGPHWR